MTSDLVLTVAVTTCRRLRFLADLLDSLAAMEPPPFAWETVVVDNAPPTAAAVVEERAAAFPAPLRYVAESRPGLHHVRHRGAREARGRFLAYLDDDLVVEPRWWKGVEPLLRGEADAVGGRILPRWETSPPPWIEKLVREELREKGYFQPLSLLDQGGTPGPIDPLLVFGGNSFLPTRLVFDLGGFHPDSMPDHLLRFRGDGETGLMTKFRTAGLRSRYEPAATAYHRIPGDRTRLSVLRRRAFLAGISSSFAAVRAEGKVPPPVPLPRLALQRSRRLLSLGLARFRMAFGVRPEDFRRVLFHAQREGRRYHLRSLRGDPSLLDWVLRKDYLD